MGRKNYKNKLAVRLLGTACTFLFLGVIMYGMVAGFNLIAGTLLIASLGGLAGPSVVAGDGILDILSEMMELVLEGIQTIVELVVDIFTSILG